MNSIKHSIKNMLLHKHSNIFLFLITVIISYSSFLILSFMDGAIYNIEQGTNRFYSEEIDIIIQNQDFNRYEQAGRWKEAEFIENYQEIISSLQELPYIKSVTPLRNFIVATKCIGSDNIDGIGLKPIDRSYPTTLSSFYLIKNGTDLSPHASNTIVLHHSFLNETKVRVGDTLVLQGQTFLGQAYSFPVEVSGFYVPHIDSADLAPLALVDVSTWSIASGYSPDQVHQLGVKFTNNHNFKTNQNKLRSWLMENTEELVSIRAEGMQADLSLAHRSTRFIIIIGLFLAFFVSSAGIISIVGSNLGNRKKEIASYYCLGDTTGYLRALYSFEIIATVVIASTISFMLIALTKIAIDFLSIKITNPALQLIFGGHIVNFGISGYSFIIVISGLLISTAISCAFSLKKALGVSPIEALRN